jgi:hypothetical protein
LDFVGLHYGLAAYCVVPATDWNYLLHLSKRPVGGQFLVLWSAMTDKARRMVGLVIAPLLMLIGLWLCLEGMWHGKLSGGIFWVGSFLALVGGLWLVSDRFDF